VFLSRFRAALFLQRGALFVLRCSAFCFFIPSHRSFFLRHGALCFAAHHSTLSFCSAVLCVSCRVAALSSQGVPVASLCGTLCFSLHHTAVCSCSVVLSVALLRSALCFCITELFSCHGAICSGALKLWGGVLFFAVRRSFFCVAAIFLSHCDALSFAMRRSFFCDATAILLRCSTLCFRIVPQCYLIGFAALCFLRHGANPFEAQGSRRLLFFASHGALTFEMRHFLCRTTLSFCGVTWCCLCRSALSVCIAFHGALCFSRLIATLSRWLWDMALFVFHISS